MPQPVLSIQSNMISFDYISRGQCVEWVIGWLARFLIRCLRFRFCVLLLLLFFFNVVLIGLLLRIFGGFLWYDDALSWNLFWSTGIFASRSGFFWRFGRWFDFWSLLFNFGKLTVLCLLFHPWLLVSVAWLFLHVFFLSCSRIWSTIKPSQLILS